MSRRDQTNADLLRNVAKTFAKVAYFQVTNAFHFNFLLSSIHRLRFARHSFHLVRFEERFTQTVSGTRTGQNVEREVCRYNGTALRGAKLSLSRAIARVLPFFSVNGKLDHSKYEFWRQPAGTLTTAEGILARLFPTTIRDIGAREINQRCWEQISASTNGSFFKKIRGRSFRPMV